MKSLLGQYFEQLLKKRTSCSGTLQYGIDEKAIHKLTTFPEKIDGKLFGYFLKAINIDADEYAEMSSIALKMSSEPGINKDDLDLTKENKSFWLENRAENNRKKNQLSLEEQKKLILNVFSKHLTKDHILEKFYHEHLFTYHVELVSQWCEYVEKQFGVKMKPMSEPEQLSIHEKYYSLGLAKRHLKLQRFLGYFRHVLSLRKNDIHFSNRKACLQHYLNYFSWHIPNSPSVLDLISGKDVFVEIYDTDFIQMYRSPDFSNVTNHSLMKLETYEWWELFHRQPEFNLKISQIAGKLLSGQLQEPIFHPIEKNIIQEINTEKPKSAMIEALAYSPIFDKNKKLTGGIHVFKYQEIKN